MRSYFNGSGVSTPPPGTGLGPGRPHRAGLMSGRASSSSLPRSPDNDTSLLTSGLGTGSGSQLGSGSGQSGHGSLGSHSSHEVSYMNIYQNTNHPHLYVSIDTTMYYNYATVTTKNITTTTTITMTVALSCSDIQLLQSLQISLQLLLKPLL